MPYIKKKDRELLLEDDTPIGSYGNLNYLITEMVNIFIQEKGLTYDTINGTIGVLECAKLELYRRVAATYENKKIQENGDVYSV